MGIAQMIKSILGQGENATSITEDPLALLSNEATQLRQGVVWQGVLNKQKKLLEGNRIQELNPVLEYIEKHEMFIMDGGYIGFMLACQPTNGVSDEIRTAYQGILSEEYPDNTLIQFSLAATPRIDDFLRRYQVLRGQRLAGRDGELADLMSQQVIDFYDQSRKSTLDHKSGVKPRDFEHWVCIKLPLKSHTISEKELKTFLDIKKKTVATLAGLGIAPEVMDDHGWLARMQSMLNYNDDALWKEFPRASRNGPVGGQILEPGNIVKRDPRGLSFADHSGQERGYATAISLKQTPNDIYYGDLINLLGDWRYGKRTPIWNPYLMTLSVRVPNQHKARKDFSQRNSWLKNQAKGKILEYVQGLKYQVQDYAAIEDEIRNASLVDVNLSMVVFGDDKESTLNATDKLVQSFKRKHYKFAHESILAPSMILNSMPLGLDDHYIQLSQRFEQWSSQGAAFLIPHAASWKGNTSLPVLEFVTRFGQTFGLDLFETDGSYNALVCARSGAGKSFIVNKIINSYLGSGVHKGNKKVADGAQVFVIDKGKSYENLTSLFDSSQFIQFNDSMEFSLNPFPNIDDFYSKDGQAGMVHNLLKAMASESGSLTDYQSTEMMNILRDLWEMKGNDATVTDYAKLCEEHEVEEIHRIGRQLQPWCENGIYGDFFGTKYPPVRFDSQLIVCEMDELTANPHLAQVVLMSIINAAQHAMFLNGTETRRLFVLDEAWEYLKDRVGKGNYLAEFLETGWRRFRKTRAAGICITQSLLDAHQSQAGKAIAMNSPWKLMLEQENEAIDALKELKAYDGSEQDFDLMKSVHTDKGHYSEIFIRYGESREIVKLFVDKKTALLYSTDADDRELIKKYRDTGMSIKEAVEMAYQDKISGSA